MARSPLRRRRGLVVVAAVVTVTVAASACSGPDGATAGSGTAGSETLVTDVSSSAPITGQEPSTATPTTSEPTTASPSEPPSTDPSIKPRQLRFARSTPVEDPYYPKTSNPEIDALHYFLDLAYTGRRLTGVVTLTFRTTQRRDAVRLDLARSLRVADVTIDGKPAHFRAADDGLSMRAPSLSERGRHTARIRYAGIPRPTSAPSTRSDLGTGLGWTRSPDGAVHTFQEPYGAFTWYPVNDHPSDKALYDARIRTTRHNLAVFNGRLASRSTSARGTTTSWHVDEPVASYLVTIAIGPYREYRDRVAGGQTISYWLMPRDRGLLPALQREGRSAYAWLTEHAGPYPFRTLGVVVVGGDSAMETQTLITMSRGAAERPDAVLQHEMAHQWYGDSVSPRDWTGMWLNEGWAMYMQQAYESDLDRYQYADGIRFWRPLDNQSRAEAGPPASYDPSMFGELNVYLGPAMMLDRIRQQIGDGTFARVMKAWPAEHENQSVDRTTFTRWISAETGHNLKPLIDLWLDSSITPP